MNAIAGVVIHMVVRWLIHPLSEIVAARSTRLRILAITLLLLSILLLLLMLRLILLLMLCVHILIAIKIRRWWLLLCVGIELLRGWMVDARLVISVVWILRRPHDLWSTSHSWQRICEDWL